MTRIVYSTSIARFGMTEEKYVSTTIGLRRLSRRQVYYGLVDDLTLEYDGNVLKKVTDEAEHPDYAEANDFVDGADKSVEYEYDPMGRLIKDLNKGIDLIRYNVLGQPCDIRSGVNHIYITYDSDGAVLSKVYGMDETIFIPPTSPWGVTRTETRFVPSLTRAWAGQYEYEDGRFTRMYTSIGWIDRDGRHTALIKDWQGNVRAAWHQGDRAVPEASAPIQRNPAKLYTGLTGYYPYGLPWATVQSKDRHLYSAKELERASDLLLYDFHARQYDPQLCRFTAPDPLSHAYEALAPHLYCAANPITFTDPTGMYVSKKVEKQFKKIKGDCLKTIRSVLRNKGEMDEEEKEQRIAQLQKTIQDLNDMENDPYIEYQLKKVHKDEMNGTTVAPEVNEKGHSVVIIRYTKEAATLAHESRHGGQIARREIKLINGTINAADITIDIEVDAYKAGFSRKGKMEYFNNLESEYDRFRTPETYFYIKDITNKRKKKVRSIKEITPDFVRNLYILDDHQQLLVPLYKNL